MKLVTYDDGKVGRIEGEEVVRLDVQDLRTYFERGGANDAAERAGLADVRLRTPLIPKKFFHTAGNYADRGMPAYVDLQEHEFAMEEQGYTATRHQREVGAGYFDRVATIVSGGESSTLALEGSTEAEQFEHEHA